MDWTKTPFLKRRHGVFLFRPMAVILFRLSQLDFLSEFHPKGESL